MPRVNPNRVKTHHSYSASELAARLKVHKNTIRHWQRQGLQAVDSTRPLLFQGGSVRAFLIARNRAQKRPCPPGMLYCFRCREPRRPALGMADFLELRGETGNLRASCETCETIMHRRIRRSAIAALMPGLHVQIREAEPRLNETVSPSANCDFERQGAK